MKIALVTGGTSLLGKAIAEKLISNNFKVYLADLNPNQIKVADADKIALDVTKSDNCEEVVRLVVKKENKIDVLINIAGISLAKPILETEEQEIKKLFDVNALGHFRLSKAVAPYMVREKTGRIINITSLNGIVSLPNFGAYSASKFAAEALNLSLRYELFGTGVYVTNIEPGAIERKISSDKAMPHKPLREKIKLLKVVLPFTRDDAIAEEVLKIITSSEPPARVIIGRDAKIITLIHKILPFSVWDSLIKFYWKKI